MGQFEESSKTKIRNVGVGDVEVKKTFWPLNPDTIAENKKRTALKGSGVKTTGSCSVSAVSYLNTIH